MYAIVVAVIYSSEKITRYDRLEGECSMIVHCKIQQKGREFLLSCFTHYAYD
jgi:hypothetical protein